jgi:hypothetical protein
MSWKILLPQEIMSEGRRLLEDAGHTIIMGRGFEAEVAYFSHSCANDTKLLY